MSQPYPYPPQGWGPPPPPPRPRRNGLVIAVVVLAIVVLGAGVTTFVLLTGDDKDGGKDTGTAAGDQQDTTAADGFTDIPMGCDLFTEDELGDYVLGTVAADDRGSGSDESASCQWSNQETHLEERTPLIILNVTTALYQPGEADGAEVARSIVENRQGSSVEVPGADEAKFREIVANGTATQADLVVRKDNAVLTFLYHHQELGKGNFAEALRELGELAVGKLG